MTLTERVKGQVHFSHFSSNELWYKTDDGFEFCVPLEDTTNSQGNQPTFLRDDKAIYFMRWIRKQMEK